VKVDEFSVLVIVQEAVPFALSATPLQVVPSAVVQVVPPAGMPVTVKTAGLSGLPEAG
jgi:hypothetical protein